MKWTFAMMFLVAAADVTVAQTKVNFDEDNALPKSWESGITGTGEAKWEVVGDDTAPSKPNCEASASW